MATYRPRPRRGVHYVAVAAATLALTSTSFAYYRPGIGSAQGTVSVAASSVAPVALTSVEFPAGQLLPGASGDVVVAMHNPNPVTVHLRITSAGAPSAVPGTGAGTCSTTGITLELPSAARLVEPGRALITLPLAASMGPEADSGCQGAVFRIPLTLSEQRTGAS